MSIKWYRQEMDRQARMAKGRAVLAADAQNRQVARMERRLALEAMADEPLMRLAVESLPSCSSLGWRLRHAPPTVLSRPLRALIVQALLFHEHGPEHAAPGNDIVQRFANQVPSEPRPETGRATIRATHLTPRAGLLR